MRLRRISWVFPAAVCYTAFAVAVTRPLAWHLRTAIPHDPGDPMLETWILWWNSQAIPFTQTWWNAPSFWPIRGAFALSDHLASLGLLATPLHWLGAGPQLVYNLVFLASFPLSAIAAHALAYWLTRRHDAALVAGLVFGFNPYRMAQMSHLQVLSSYGMPVALLALHRYLDAHRDPGAPARRAWRWLLLFGVAWLLQSLANGYLLLYFSFLVSLFLLWFVRWRRSFHSGVAILAAWMLFGALLVPVLWQYLSVQRYWGLGRDYQEIASYSGNLASFVTRTPLMAVGWVTPVGDEQELYPGVVAVAVMLVGLAAAVRVRTHTRATRAACVLAAGGAALLAVAASVLIAGPWKLDLPGLTVTVRQFWRPVYLAVPLLVAAAALHPGVRTAWSRRSPLAFYAVATFVVWMACLGPTGRLLGSHAMERPPYWWLMALPGFNAIRVPTRFAMVAALTLGVAAALGLARLTRPWPRRCQVAAAAVCAFLIAADSWTHPLPLHRPPETYSLPVDAPPDAAVLEFPVRGAVRRDVDAMYRSMSHRRAVVAGWSGYDPESYVLLAQSLARFDASVVHALTGFGPLYLVVDQRIDAAGKTADFVASTGARLVSHQGPRGIWYLPSSPDRRWRAEGTRLAIASVTASTNGANARLAIDGRIDTAWRSALPQLGDESVIITLAEQADIGGLVLSLGSHRSDFPRTLAIDGSPDGSAWQRLWQGEMTGAALTALVDDRATMPLRVPLPASRARYLRLRQVTRDLTMWWAIAEVAVIAADRHHAAAASSDGMSRPEYVGEPLFRDARNSARGGTARSAAHTARGR